MRAISKATTHQIIVDQNSEGQRLDNFLIKIVKTIPKNHIYKIIRKGEVRVNSRRCQAGYRLEYNDKIRIPPLEILDTKKIDKGCPELISSQIVYEDNHLLIVNKPSGIAVHGGSGVSQGIIESLRKRDDGQYLELAHRLDRNTSGVLVLAKNRKALISLHQQFRNGQITKKYNTLVSSKWPFKRKITEFPLLRTHRQGGERHVIVNKSGQEAKTLFHLLEKKKQFCLLEAQPFTGRTHQIRVHLAHIGYPVAGDDKYGDDNLNKLVKEGKNKRMFLHAKSLKFDHPSTGKVFRVAVELPDSFNILLISD